MVRIIVFSCLLVASFVGKSEIIYSRIESARVFVRSAEVHRTAQTRLQAGYSQIVISGLPLDLVAESIQMQSKGNIDILSVRHRTDYLATPHLEQDIKALQDSLDFYTRSLVRQQNALKVYEEEETFLLANKSIGGSESGVKLADLRDIAGFFRNRLMEVKNLQQQTQEEIKKTRERQERIRRQLNEQNAQRQIATGQIWLEVNAHAAGNAVFMFSYISRQAGWHPAYDLRAGDTEQPIDLVMKANVFQNTGEEWSNIELSLSTGSPSVRKEKPDLSPWYLRFIEPVVARSSAQRRAVETFAVQADYEMAAPPITMVSEEAPTLRLSQTHTTTEYHIPQKQSIPSANKTVPVDLHQTQLPALFEHYAVPRLLSDVFLIAKVTDWEAFVKLPGEANIFFEGSYVGKTNINPQVTSDTLFLSLGVDAAVSVERKRLEDFSKKSILGRRTTETVAWEIVARNNKNQSVVLNLHDQIPLTTHSDMEVSLEEKSGAFHEAQTGYLHWKESLAPRQALNKTFRYTVRYPSDKKLIVE